MFIVIYLLFLTLSPSLQRNYDIEEECHKRIGSDLNGTIARFRKSREYAKILADKMAEVISMIKDSVVHGQYVYNEEYMKEAEEIAGKIPKYTERLISSQGQRTPTEKFDEHFEKSNRVPMEVKNNARASGFEYAKKIADDCIASLKSETQSNLERSGNQPAFTSSEYDGKVETLDLNLESDK